MKIKILFVLIVLISAFAAGCVEEDKPGPETEPTPTEIETPEETPTPEETETPEETPTPEETETPEIREIPYDIKLQYFKALPSVREIKEGEKIVWWNLHDNPKRSFTLVSEDRLFENTTLVYKRPFVHTFNETGTYNFSIVGQPRMDMTVNVAEP